MGVYPETVHLSIQRKKKKEKERIKNKKENGKDRH